MHTSVSFNATQGRQFPNYSYKSMIQDRSSSAITGDCMRFMDIPNRAGGSFASPHMYEVQPNDGHSTNYSCAHLDGHVYEEVGPPSQTHPYHVGNMLTGHPMMTASSCADRPISTASSLCHMCSVGHSGGIAHGSAAHGSVRQSHTLQSHPLCHCTSTHTLVQPVCGVHSAAGSAVSHPCNNFPHQSCTAHRCSSLLTFSPLPGGQHVPLHGMCSHEQRYMLPESATSNDSHTLSTEMVPAPSGDGHNDNRSYSPFHLLRKCNRDSKASSNNMLDSTSSKSLLAPCGKKMLIAILAMFVMILVVSVAVGIIVTISVDKQDALPVTSSTSAAVSDIERVSRRLYASVTVSRGPRSLYMSDYSRPGSKAFDAYAANFTYSVDPLLTAGGDLAATLLDYTQILRLRNQSSTVVVEFIIRLKADITEQEGDRLVGQIRRAFEQEKAANGTFNQLYPISPEGIKLHTLFTDSELTTPSTIDGSSAPSSQPPAIAMTTPSITPPSYVIPPASGVCQPINSSVCQHIHYNSSGTTFPNFVNHSSQAEANVMVTIINAIMASTSCYDHLNTFSCALLAPKCGENNSRIPPCRNMCRAALEKCGVYMNVVMDNIGTRINCSYFPDSADPDVCVDENAPVVPTAPPTCPSGYFSCDNHSCLPLKDRCDSVSDCRDGRDEQECDDFQCVDGQFTCSNGQCRPKVWRCDGRDDCGDGSDEEGCEPVGSCKVGEFKCVNGTDVWDDDECISGTFTCDTTKDCSDGSDEDEDFCRDRSRKR